MTEAISIDEKDQDVDLALEMANLEATTGLVKNGAQAISVFVAIISGTKRIVIKLYLFEIK